MADAVGEKMTKMASTLASEQGGTNRSLEGTDYKVAADKNGGKDLSGHSAGGGGK